VDGGAPILRDARNFRNGRYKARSAGGAMCTT
jgi:hypothetical protein